MATIQQDALARESRLFVGRERELALFRSWLAADTPTILSVSGPGGVGKTALLSAFEREAQAAGRSTVRVDGRAILPTREDFLAALGHRDLDEAVRDL